MKEPYVERVRVYRNLHKNCWSVMTKTDKGERPSGWRVAYHSQNLLLAEPKFIVREGGRQKVIATKRKNVHAFIEGNLFERPKHLKKPLEHLAKITYKPYRFGYFFFDHPEKYSQGCTDHEQSCHDDPAVRLIRLCPTGVFVVSVFSMLKVGV